MRGFKLIAAIAALAAVLSACSTVKLDEPAAVEDRAGKAPSTSASSAQTGAGNTGNAGNANDAGKNAKATDPLDDPASVLAKRSVYFDLDKYDIKDEFKPVIEAHGKYLASHPNRKVIIQGNTDERGGSEYNLALGQKRAESVRRALAAAGAQDGQMEAVSFGKEKPKATGSNEAAWAENRRADLAY
jgi:peptidoglycan-associated lipoprotein